MKEKKVFLLLNGEAPTMLPNLLNYEIICATDGAYHHLEENNIVPNLVCGDLDSSQEIPKNIEVIHTPDQDFTDFDKTLQILLDKGFTEIDVFGASGKEQDHFLGNLHTAIQFRGKLNLTFFDNYSRYFLADNSTTEGLQYSLKNEDLIFGERIGTRNKAIKNNVKITFKSGELFIFINHKIEKNE
jgi:thiamine pyrophosphokinase